jgi:uncharacterized protein (TIGR03435 family)
MMDSQMPLWKSACILLLAAALLPAADPAFAVVSIHRHAPNDTRFFVRPPSAGHFTAAGADAKLLIMLAYDIQESQIAGSEEALTTDKWDILAKSDTGTGTVHTVEETRVMLRNALAERFGLRAHWETRDLSAYVLTVSKNGYRFRESQRDAPNVRVSGNSIALEGGDFARLTQLLSSALGRPVVDRTGLTGHYDLQLQWDDAPIPTGGVMGANAPAAVDNNHGSIFTAVDQQLGLRLSSGRAPVRVLVIDHFEPATEN